LLASRLKRIFPSLISINQGGFVPGKKIIHNIIMI